MQNSSTKEKVKKLVTLSILSAIIILLQLFGSYIRIGNIPFSLVLIPIVLGAMMYGPGSGALLGFVFSFVVYIQTLTGVDVFSVTLFTSDPPLSYVILTVLIFAKGTLAGLASGYAYKALSAKNEIAGTFVAAILTPVVNTSIFLLFAGTYFFDVIKEKFSAGADMLYFLFIGLAGVNFLIELGLNVVLAPVIYRLFKISQKNH